MYELIFCTTSTIVDDIIVANTVFRFSFCGHRTYYLTRNQTRMDEKVRYFQLSLWGYWLYDTTSASVGQPIAMRYLDFSWIFAKFVISVKQLNYVVLLKKHFVPLKLLKVTLAHLTHLLSLPTTRWSTTAMEDFPLLLLCVDWWDYPFS